MKITLSALKFCLVAVFATMLQGCMATAMVSEATTRHYLIGQLESASQREDKSIVMVGHHAEIKGDKSPQWDRELTELLFEPDAFLRVIKPYNMDTSQTETTGKVKLSPHRTLLAQPNGHVASKLGESREIRPRESKLVLECHVDGKDYVVDLSSTEFKLDYMRRTVWYAYPLYLISIPVDVVTAPFQLGMIMYAFEHPQGSRTPGEGQP